jgi:hypothetical protein
VYIDGDVYLEHYGVKGMRWGVVNEDDTSGDGGSAKQDPKNRVSSDKARLTPKQKKMLIGGAAVAGTLLVAYGGYKLSNSGQLNAAGLRVKEKLNLQEGPFKINKELARKDLTADQIQSLVNKGANPDYGAMGTKLNCRRSTFAYEMRRRGYDVSATKTMTGEGQKFSGVYNALNTEGGRAVGDSKGSLRRALKRETRAGKTGLSDAFDVLEGRGRNFVEPVNDSHVSGIFRGLLGQPDGARGEVSMNWQIGGRHSMAWEIIGGRPHVFDAQTGEHFASAQDLRRSIGDSSISEASFLRLDNVPMNTNFLQRWLRNAN